MSTAWPQSVRSLLRTVGIARTANVEPLTFGWFEGSATRHRVISIIVD